MSSAPQHLKVSWSKKGGNQRGEPQSGASPASRGAGAKAHRPGSVSLRRSLTSSTGLDPWPFSWAASRPSRSAQEAAQPAMAPTANPRPAARPPCGAADPRAPTCLPLRLHAQVLAQFPHRPVADGLLAGRQPLSELDLRRLHDRSHHARRSTPDRAPATRAAPAQKLRWQWCGAE